LSSEKDIEKVEELTEYKPALIKTLNFVALFLALVLIIVIYVPTIIWREEDQIRNEGRQRMLILNSVEKYYHQMTGEYETDPITAMKVLSAVRDSTRADSNFFGEQTIKLNNKKFKMNVPKNFYFNFDTTFAFSYVKKDTAIDTTYKVTKWNNELFSWDTVYVLAQRWRELESDSTYRGPLGVETSERVMENTYYLPYYLTKKFAYSPLINEQFVITTDSQGYKIKDPLQGEHKENRYLFFTFKDTCYGWIENDQLSWER
jgi:hypothetical protein